MLGALRQGQVEVMIVDPNGLEAYDIAWRLRLEKDQLENDMIELQDNDLIELDDDCWLICNFSDRQGRSQAEKRKGWNERQRNKRARDKEKKKNVSHASDENSVTEESRVTHGSRGEERRGDIEEEEKKDSRSNERNRTKSFKDKIRGEIADHFSETTGLSLPELNTAKQKKAAGSLWFTPIREICDLVEWRKDDAQALVDAAIARMDEDKLTIANPISILKVCQSIVGEVKRGSYKPEYSFENEMEKFRRSEDG